MKKIILLFMLILSAKTLNGIEPKNSYDVLPEESSNDLKDFTQLVHMLANKSKELPSVVAQKFNTPTAKTYVALGDKLLLYTRYYAVYPDYTFNDIVQLVEQGADVNFVNKSYWTALENAIMNQDIKLVQLLLNSGAIVTPYNLTEAINIEAELMSDIQDTHTATTIKHMIENAIQNKTNQAEG